MTYRLKLLQKRLDERRRQLQDAEKRGESEAFLALCRFKIEEIELAIASERGQ